jgi:signal transduction histidine kinase
MRHSNSSERNSKPIVGFPDHAALPARTSAIKRENKRIGNTDRRWAGDIVDRIRDHIKKEPPRKKHVDLNEAINEVIVLGRSAVIRNGVSVQTRLCEGLFPIHCDRVQLQQVVLNLILNAVEAMGRSSQGRKNYRSAGVLVAVRDSGPGIDPTHLERVFEAFYTTKSRGVGMRLSICRSTSTPMGAGCGQRRTNLAAPYFSSPCLPCRGDHEFSSPIRQAGIWGNVRHWP